MLDVLLGGLVCFAVLTGLIWAVAQGVWSNLTRDEDSEGG